MTYNLRLLAKPLLSQLLTTKIAEISCEDGLQFIANNELFYLYTLIKIKITIPLTLACSVFVNMYC